MMHLRKSIIASKCFNQCGTAKYLITDSTNNNAIRNLFIKSDNDKPVDRTHRYNKKTNKNKLWQNNDHAQKVPNESKVFDIIKKLEEDGKLRQQQINFENEIKFRRDQAQKSVIVKLPFDSGRAKAEQLAEDLKTTCHSLNCDLKNVFLVGTIKETYALLEFNSVQCIENLLNETRFFNSSTSPTTIRLLYFHGSNKNINQNKSNSYRTSPVVQDHRVKSAKDFGDIDLSTQTKDSMSDQIKYLYTSNCLNEIDYRTRYFISSIFEDSVKAIFKDVVVLPFGSSGNKFGSRTSDLDLSLSLDGYYLTKKQNPSSRNNHNLFYISKEKSNINHTMLFDFLAVLCSKILPKFRLIDKIISARVPILKFDAYLATPIACDISATNVETSFLMTKLFWTFNNCDVRVAPLVFAIRQWAKRFKIPPTIQPSPKITSYQLTMMVLHYLIKKPQPVLVSMDKFVTKQQVMTDKDELEAYLRTTSIMDPSDVISKLKVKNQISVAELMEGFFEYYANFDFDNSVISLTDKPVNNNINRQISTKIYIENPFDCSLNAAKNVGQYEVANFKEKCMYTLTLLQSSRESLNLATLLNQIDRVSDKNKFKQKLPSISDVLTREMHDY